MKVDAKVKEKILSHIQDNNVNANDHGSAKALIKKLSQKYDVSEHIIEQIIAEHQASSSQK